MAQYVIQGGKALKGEIDVGGNKNSTFPCMAAALLTDKPVTLSNIPKIRDVDVFLEILEHLGVSVSFQEHKLTIDASKITTTDLPESLTGKLRGSVLLAGALLARAGKVSFSHPGGDVIGKRAINLHLEGFEKLGYDVKTVDRHYHVTSGKHETKGDVTIFFEIATVTGTENLILASVKRPGTTTIKNAAQEPHVVDLCKMLAQMGATIHGIGTSTLVINGKHDLHGTEFEISSDYIEVGTYAAAAALTRGTLTIKNIKHLDTDPFLWPLEKMGVKMARQGDTLIVSSQQLKALPSLITNVWPGFPTDLMSVIIVLATQAQGVSLMHDWIYESRMFFVDKLIGMGANITIADPHRVVIYGPTKLRGRNLETPDIRAGIALVLAALIANGQSVIDRAELIERGYEDVVDKLSSLGADIQRVEN